MSKKSDDFMFRCIDTIHADKTLSDDTLVIMFTEYKRLIFEEMWTPVKDKPPLKYGRYEVYRKGCNKQHYETWNGTGWSSNNNDITHYRFIKPPTN